MSEIKPAVGMILMSSWGYDQTNIDFYKIVRVSEKGTVWIQELSKSVVAVTGWAHQEVVPIDEPRVWANGRNENDETIWQVAPISRHRWNKWNGVSLNSFSGAWIWDGKPRSQSQTH